MSSSTHSRGFARNRMISDGRMGGLMTTSQSNSSNGLYCAILTHSMDGRNSKCWGHFWFLALPPLLYLEHFLQIISKIILQFHPQPLDARNSIQWLGTFFFGTSTPSGLKALYAQKSMQWLGTFLFFWHYHPFWT